MGKKINGISDIAVVEQLANFADAPIESTRGGWKVHDNAQVVRTVDGRLYMQHVQVTERVAEISETDYARFLEFAETHRDFETTDLAWNLTQDCWREKALPDEDAFAYTERHIAELYGERHSA